jgi:phenylalanine-specific permease
LILVLMCTMDEMRLSAMLLPVWVVFLFIAFKLSQKVARFLPLPVGEGR